MRSTFRAAASLLCIGMALSACGGHSSVPPIAGAGPSGNSSGPTTESQAQAVIGAVPHPTGRLAISDLGRRSANEPVNVAVTLRYNHQSQLDELVREQSDRLSGMYHHYLTTAQFNGYYAPTAAQETAVVDALRAAGFTITHRFDNRTIVDATAPSSAVERFFSTQMHTVSQGKFGRRYMNVKAPTIPSRIADYIKDVSLNDLIVVHTGADSARHAVDSRISVPAFSARRTTAVHPSAGNVLLNPGFETGRVNGGWIQCGNINASVTTAHPHTGRYDEKSGNGSSEPNGDTGVCQQVTIPASGVLTFYVYQLSDETDTTYAWQEADLLDGSGNVVQNFYYSVNNQAGWVQKSLQRERLRRSNLLSVFRRARRRLPLSVHPAVRRRRQPFGRHLDADAFAHVNAHAQADELSVSYTQTVGLAKPHAQTDQQPDTGAGRL